MHWTNDTKQIGGREGIWWKGWRSHWSTIALALHQEEREGSQFTGCFPKEGSDNCSGDGCQDGV